MSRTGTKQGLAIHIVDMAVTARTHDVNYGVYLVAHRCKREPDLVHLGFTVGTPDRRDQGDWRHRVALPNDLHKPREGRAKCAQAKARGAIDVDAGAY